jgi:hypothetical protein
MLLSGFKYRRFFSAGGLSLSEDPLPQAAPEGNGAETSAAAETREETRRRRRDYERSRVYQDIWATKLPWAESVLGNDGKVHQVRCLVCTKINGREKLLAPKLDTL